jgi:hypothetical protein
MPVQSCNDSDNLDAEEIFHISHFETLPVTSDAIARETRRDRVLSRNLAGTITRIPQSKQP